MILSGGCQCGAVRFAVDSDVLYGHALCHCRMCQKAFSSPYAALICAPTRAVTWTRGQPTLFQSSTQARRGFCNQCGSPLTYESEPGEIELASVSFDTPGALIPVHQTSHDTRIRWTDHMDAITWREGSFEKASIISLQHPDYDTPND